MSKEVFSLINENPVDTELNQQLLEQCEQDTALQSEVLFSLKVNSRRDERLLAFYVLYSIDRSDYSFSVEKVAESFQNEFDVTLPQDPFYKKMVEGVIQDREKLDTYLIPYLKNWKLERLGCCTRLTLRLALWELLTYEVAPSVVINEAIELAKAFGERDSYKFVNGVLDEIAKRLPAKEDLPASA